MIEYSCPRCECQPEFCKCLDADVVAAERDARDAAWARLVKAALDEVSTTEAREALRAMGVDVEKMLEDR